MKNVKKAVLAVLTVGVLVGGIAGAALAGHNNPNLAANGHPGYAPDYYYPLSAAQSGPMSNIRRDVPSSPYWSVEGSVGDAPNAQPTAQATATVPFAS